MSSFLVGDLRHTIHSSPAPADGNPHRLAGGFAGYPAWSVSTVSIRWWCRFMWHDLQSHSMSAGFA
jgi:hypothetical protein